MFDSFVCACNLFVLLAASQRVNHTAQTNKQTNELTNKQINTQINKWKHKWAKKASQLFVIWINLLQNSGNLPKRPKSTILSFSLRFDIFHFVAIFLLVIIFLFKFTNSAIFFFCLYWFTNRAIFLSKEKKEKIIPLFVKWNLM
jgi:Flp pilus assembly protein TadB